MTAAQPETGIVNLSNDLWIYVEDPGAANYVAPLVTHFQAQGWRVTLWAGGSAYTYLSDRGTPCLQVVAENAADLVSEFIKCSPRLLLVGTAENPDTLGFKLIAAARDRAIPSIGVIDAYANAPNRWRGHSNHPLTHAPDWLLVPDQLTAQAYRALGYPPANLVVCGHPHYDWIRERVTQLEHQGRPKLRQQMFPNWPGDRLIMVFVAELSTGLDAQQYQRSPDYTLSGTGQSDRRTDIVLEEFLLARQALATPVYVVLRLHPKNDRTEFLPYLPAFDQVSQGGDPLAMVYCADLVVGMTSMLLVEAHLARRPVLSILPRAIERDWLPLPAGSDTQIVSDRTALRAALAHLANLSSPPTTNLDRPNLSLTANESDQCHQKIVRFTSSWLQSS